MSAIEIHAELRESLKRNLSASKLCRLSEFMYKYSEFSEELFAGLLDELCTVSPLKRLHLFYLVDVLLKDAERFEFDGYNNLIKHHALSVIDLTLDITRTENKAKLGAPMNSFGVVKTLEQWLQRDIITESKLEKIKTLVTISSRTSKPNLTKDQIWKRMEEDRDRQKKAREDSWARKVVDGEDDPEFLDAWAKARPLSRTDLNMFEDMYLKYQLS